jgi:hypothetical protein
MQNRSGPTATTRAGDDFEWVNSWAEASGLKAAQEFAAQPAKTPPAKTASPIVAAPPPVVAAPRIAPAAASPVLAPSPPVVAARVPVPANPSATFAASGQLAQDIAEIERARDAIIAAEGTGAFVLPPPSRPKGRLLGRRDAVPVLIGAMLAMLMLVVYGAFATFMSLGH